MSQSAVESPWAASRTSDRWRARGREALGVLGTKLALQARRAGKRLAGESTVLRHGLAALERGNFEAAFWLLREEVARQPDDSRTVQAFWDAAVACGQADAAAAPMSRLVERQATQQPELGAASWIALESASPDAPVNALTLARLLPALKARAAEASGEEARQEARTWLLHALRRSVVPGSGLAGGVALRIFEEARGLEPEVARRAAEIALASPNLHEAKRARLEAHLAEPSAPAPPAVSVPDRDRSALEQADPGPAQPAREGLDGLAVTEAIPVELDAQGLVLREEDTGLRSRFDPRQVESIWVGAVGDLGVKPVWVVDLVLRGDPSAGAGGRAVVRLRGDRFEAERLVPPGPSGEDPRRTFLAALLEHTGAVPLPDPDAALGIRPRHFESLAAYEAALRAQLATPFD